MKTVFIINPCAGKKKNTDSLISKIKSVSGKHGADTEIYITKSSGDATVFVREYCNARGGARFIACGGDGTLGEVLCGAMGCEDAEIGVLPMGTGNDFCRNFGKEPRFDDIALQIFGRCMKCDAIKYTTEVDGEIREGYGANMFNIGFDCKVADFTSEIKEKTFLSGALAYFASILVTLVKKECSDLKVALDGETVHDGKLLLTSVANGCYCGGGIKSNPLADVSDGLISVNIINNISRLRFISLLPYYMKGNFMKLRGIDKVISSVKCKKITVEPASGFMRLCVDGEIRDAGKTELEIVHNAFNFVLPIPCEIPAPKECTAL